MSDKLYPPDIGGVIPAFFGTELKVPFTMNKSVSQTQIGGFELIVKTVSTSKVLGYLDLTFTTDDDGNMIYSGWDTANNILTFDITSLLNKLKVKQYYKVQLAYKHINGLLVGYYSNVATVKYTAQPKVIMEDMDNLSVNMNENTFIGYYSNVNDPAERVYSYRFDVMDKSGIIYDTSNDCLHNSFEDNKPTESRDIFILNKDLKVNETYYIQYAVTTTNKLTFSSPKYLIMQKDTIDPELRAAVNADLDRENGYIRVTLVGEKNQDGIEPAAIGSFYLKRASSKDDYGIWQTVYQFRLNGQLPSQWSWKDMTIEHGYKYKYALQQYSEKLISNRVESNEVYAEFEDAFLYDGERQLKIKYNPKVSSFKTTLLESKQDTIGSKYPFFFRNGNVAYKEFPISGLISYYSDEQELFITKEELLLEEATTNLTDNNIAAERIFKMSVLDWLNNGQPKIFRSPAEGNFIVRLLNISLSPADTVGRMLHSFSATAYEVSEFNYDTVMDLGFLSLSAIEEDTTTRWETVDLTSGEMLNLNYPITSLIISDAIPGTQFSLKLKGQSTYSNPITIGSTGMYKIDLGDNVEIIGFQVNSSKVTSGTLMYSYESSVQNVFDTITDVNINDWLFVQYIGEHDDVIGEMEEKVTYEKDGAKVIFQGLKKELLGLKYLRFFKRAVYDVYSHDDEYYWDTLFTNKVDNLEDTYIYLVHNEEEAYYIDGKNGSVINNYTNTFVINNESYIDLTETESMELPANYDIRTLQLGSGVIFECAYQTKEITYSLESRSDIAKLKANYIHELNWYLAVITGTTTSTPAKTQEEYYQQMIKARDKFLIALYEAIEEQKEATGYYV